MFLSWRCSGWSIFKRHHCVSSQRIERDGKEIHTYAIDFVDSVSHFQASSRRPSLDAPWAKRVSEYIGSKHQTITIDTPDLIENLLVPMRIHHLPAKGQIETSQYLLCKAMRKDATIGLSGAVADEVFGGYFNETSINAPTFPWLAANNMELTGHKRHLFWLSPDVEQKIQPDEYIAQIYQESLAEIPHLEGEDPKAARRREISYLILTNFLPIILDRNHRMSTAGGFEILMPFCDHRLVEYLWNIPWEMKTVGGVEKGLLRQALVDILPDDALNRRKSAYPVTQNPTYQETTHTWAAQILHDPNAPILPFINANALQSLVEGKLALPKNPGGTIFEHLIQINTWLQQYQISVV